MRATAVAVLLVVAGCGSGSTGATPDPAAAASATRVTPAPATPTGTPVPEALSSFRCLKDSKGRWKAGGTIANAGTQPVTYQVTVYIGAAAGGEEKARTKQVADVQAGGSAKFAIGNIPGPSKGAPCHVQVLAGR